MTDEQVGKYARALCAQHQHGHLSEIQLQSILKGDSAVAQKFIKDDIGLFFNVRMDEEIKKRAEYCETQKKNAQKRWEKGADRPIPTVNANANAIQDEDKDEDKDERHSHGIAMALPRHKIGNAKAEEETQNCELFQYWISRPFLAKHRTYTKDMRAASVRVMSEYPIEDLKAAITALNEILPSVEQYLGVIPWTFDDFFRKGSPQKPAPFKKFLPENNPIQSLKRRDLQTQRVKNEYEHNAASKYDGL